MPYDDVKFSTETRACGLSTCQSAMGAGGGATGGGASAGANEVLRSDCFFRVTEIRVNTRDAAKS